MDFKDFTKLTKCLFRQCFYPGFNQVKLHRFYVDPRSADRKKRNKEIRARNGNIFQKQLAVYHQNIPGRKNPKDVITDVESLLQKLVPDILVISEADTKVVTAWKYPGYTAHQGRVDGAELVRVSALVRSGIPHTITFLECEVPHIVINFKLENKQYRCTGVYREWNHGGVESSRGEQTDRWTIFEDAWVANNRRCRHSILLGDLNFCYKGNGTPHQASLEPIRSSVMDNIVFRGWVQLIDKNTRHQGENQKPSCLDHIYMNFPDQVKYSVNKAFGGGDHNCVGVVVKTKRFIQQGEEFISRCWGKVNWSWGKYLLKYSSVFYKAFSFKDPNEILDSIEVELRTVMDTIAPEQIIKIKPGSQRWMTAKVLKKLEIRDKLKEAWHKSGCPVDLRKFREARTEARLLVRRAKEAQVEADLEVKDLKKRWKKIKVITGGEPDSGPPTEIVEAGVTYKEDVDIANVLNQGFRQKVDGILSRVKMDPKRAMELFEEYAQGLEKKNGKFGKFEFTEVDCKVVRDACMSLQNTAALGTDGIPTIVIKELSWELAPYLAYLINTIFRTGVFPDRWRQGIITPIHKGGARNVKTNYRPVTITNSLSKVFERIANNQITNYFTSYGIIDGSQHAYQVNRGTNTYWADLVAKLSLIKDAGKKALLQVFDLSAAFNLLHVDIMKPKLARVGFQTSAINILAETMTRRLLKTKIGGAYSEVAVCSVGSAEGGILSPGLFNFTLCDIAAIKGRVEAAAAKGIRTEAAMLQVQAGTKTLEETREDVIKVPSAENHPGGYADDNGFVNGTNTEEELRAVAFETDNQVMNYFEVNGMAANAKKTEAISVLNRFSRPIKVGDIESQAEIKLLGLKMSDKMSFLPQAQEVVRKVSAKLPNLLRLKEWASKELLIKTADSVLLSHFNYLLEVFGGETRVQVLLQRCQNKIMRALLGKQLTDRVPVTALLAEVGWDSVQNMVRLKTLFWIRKIDRMRVAPFMARLLSTGSNTTYNTRRWRLDVPFVPRLLVTANCFLHRSLSIYNDFNLYTNGAQMEEYREIIRDKVLSTFPNGNC